MPIGIGGAVLGGGLLSGASSLFGAGKGASAATKAAQIQASAAQNIAQLQYQMYQQSVGRLQPFVDAGQQATNTLGAAVNDPNSWLQQMPTTWGMTNEFTPTMQSLANTPGYQFTLQQGEQATTNAYAPMGLAGTITGGRASPSGPLAAAQTQFAEGLAGTTFQQQYQNWLQGQQLQQTQQQAQFNRLSNVAGLGESAAAGAGSLGLGTSGQVGSTLTTGAAASAAGTIGAANSIIGGVSGAGNALGNSALLYALTQPGMFAGSTPGLGGGASEALYNQATQVQ